MYCKKLQSLYTWFYFYYCKIDNVYPTKHYQEWVYIQFYSILQGNSLACLKMRGTFIQISKVVIVVHFSNIILNSFAKCERLHCIAFLWYKCLLCDWKSPSTPNIFAYLFNGKFTNLFNVTFLPLPSPAANKTQYLQIKPPFAVE